MYRDSPKPEFLYTLRHLIRCTQAFERYSGVHVRQMGLTESQFDVVATLGNNAEWRELRLAVPGGFAGVAETVTKVTQ